MAGYVDGMDLDGICLWLWWNSGNTMNLQMIATERDSTGQVIWFD
jgi:hypothetical protein